MISENFNVIYHYLFLDGINDSHDEVGDLINFFLSVSPDYNVIRDSKQLRILRYNKCDKSRYTESKSFSQIIERLNIQIPEKLKVQVSPGSEISAACGQFLMRLK